MGVERMSDNEAPERIYHVPGTATVSEHRIRSAHMREYVIADLYEAMEASKHIAWEAQEAHRENVEELRAALSQVHGKLIAGKVDEAIKIIRRVMPDDPPF